MTSIDKIDTAAERKAAAGKPAVAVAAKQLKLTLIRSVFGRLQAHRACVRGLGLTRMHSSVVIPATVENMGMVRKVGFMLKVEEI